MKKAVLIMAALLMISGAAYACPSIGLFVDGAHSVCEVINPGGFYPFEMWVWVSSPRSDVPPFPLVDGMMCTEFAISYPPNIIQSTVTWNDPIISVKMGDLPSGLSVCYVGCQYGWVWICHQACYLTDTMTGFIEIIPHPTVVPPQVQVSTCEDGFPIIEIAVYAHLALNQPCIVGTEESSWSAIKSMYNE